MRDLVLLFDSQVEVLGRKRAGNVSNLYTKTGARLPPEMFNMQGPKPLRNANAQASIFTQRAENPVGGREYAGSRPPTAKCFGPAIRNMYPYLIGPGLQLSGGAGMISGSVRMNTQPRHIGYEWRGDFTPPNTLPHQ